MRTSFLAAPAIAVLAADVALKALASAGIKLMLIPNLFEFGLTRNPNLVFGVPAAGTLTFVLTLVLFLIVIALGVTRIVLGAGRGYWLLLIGVAGGINFTDRYLYGAVRDYALVPATGFAFNLADVAIILGILGFVGTFEFRRRDNLKPQYVVPR